MSIINRIPVSLNFYWIIWQTQGEHQGNLWLGLRHVGPVVQTCRQREHCFDFSDFDATTESGPDPFEIHRSGRSPFHRSAILFTSQRRWGHDGRSLAFQFDCFGFGNSWRCDQVSEQQTLVLQVWNLPGMSSGLRPWKSTKCPCQRLVILHVCSTSWIPILTCVAWWNKCLWHCTIRLAHAKWDPEMIRKLWSILGSGKFQLTHGSKLIDWMIRNLSTESTGCVDCE